MSKIDMLEELLAGGRFDHATYRDFGTLWEGLWIYERDPSGFRGYRPALSFGKNDAELDEAYKRLRGVGIHLGAYGQG